MPKKVKWDREASEFRVRLDPELWIALRDRYPQFDSLDNQTFAAWLVQDKLASVPSPAQLPAPQPAHTRQNQEVTADVQQQPESGTGGGTAAGSPEPDSTSSSPDQTGAELDPAIAAEFDSLGA